jgi:hypothetical protein
LFESFQIFALFNILAANVTDQSTNPVDVICQTHHADYFNKNEADGLLVGTGNDISEANCEHDVATPIVSPNILLEPNCIGYSSGEMPVIRTNVSHTRQEDCQDMCKAEIEEKHLD